MYSYLEAWSCAAQYRFAVEMGEYQVVKMANTGYIFAVRIGKYHAVKMGNTCNIFC